MPCQQTSLSVLTDHYDRYQKIIMTSRLHSNIFPLASEGQPRQLCYYSPSVETAMRVAYRQGTQLFPALVNS